MSEEDSRSRLTVFNPAMTLVVERVTVERVTGALAGPGAAGIGTAVA